MKRFTQTVVALAALLALGATVHAQAYTPASGTATNTSASKDCGFKPNQLWLRNDSATVTLYVNPVGSTATTSSMPVLPLETHVFWVGQASQKFSVITAASTAAYRAQCSSATTAIQATSPTQLGASTLSVAGSITAGASGTVGSVNIYPATASKGYFTLNVSDQTGNTAVTLNADAMGQATSVHIPDPGGATSYVMQSTAANTLAENDVLHSVTAGTVAVSKAVVVDANKDITTFRNLTATNLIAGASGTAGTIKAYPTTGSKGYFAIGVTDQTGNTAVTQQIDAMGQATTVHLADPGAATSYYMQSTAANTLAENDTLHSVTAGTVSASKAVVVDANKDIGAFRVVSLSSEQGSYATKALTSGGAAAAFAKVTVPSGSTAAFIIKYAFEVTDATDYQVYSGTVPVTAVNKGGTITCNVGTPSAATEITTASTGSISAHAITCADAGSNVLDLKAADTTGLTPTYNRIRYRVDALAPAVLVIAAQ